MTVQTFEKFHGRRPFPPFTIHLADGTSLPVRSPEFVSRSEGGRTLLVATQGEDFAYVDLLLVTHLTDGVSQNGRRRKTKKR
jgi:hypothetical protein